MPAPTKSAAPIFGGLLLLALATACPGPGAEFATWETAGEPIRNRIVAQSEVRAFLPGAYCTLEATDSSTGGWMRIMQVRIDDQVSFPEDRVVVLDAGRAYVFMASQYAVTTDQGRSWSSWRRLA